MAGIRRANEAHEVYAGALRDQSHTASRAPRLTAAEAAAVLGVSQQELASLIEQGVLHPAGPDAPGARRFPAAQVEAVLNGLARDAVVVPMRTRDGQDGGAQAGRAPLSWRGTQVPRPALRASRGGAHAASAAPANGGTPGGDAGTEQQARYLYALHEAMDAIAGEQGAGELLWRQEYPFLPYLRVGGADIWVVRTSTGWRFLWNRYQSHPASDPGGAAEVITRYLGPGVPGAREDAGTGG
jgi:hypothetical protein